MIYIDPPYGVKFGATSSHSVRKRDVKHGGERGHDRRARNGEGVSWTRWDFGPVTPFLTDTSSSELWCRDLLADAEEFSRANFGRQPGHHVASFSTRFLGLRIC